MLASTSPTCTAITNLYTGLSCTFSSNNKLILTSVLNTASVAGGTSFSFSVNTGLNPYNGVPKTGFTL